MNSRERTIRAIEFKTPDRVPIWHTYTNHYAYKNPDFLRSILDRYPADACTNAERDPFPETIPSVQELDAQRGRFATDEWGCVWQYEEPGMQGIVIDHPIKTYDQVKDLAIPDPQRVGWPAFKETMKARKYQRYVWTYPPNFFHLLTFLLGFEKFVVDLTLEEEGLFALMDRILNEHHIPYLRHLVESDCDGLFFGDDLGTQTQLQVSPKTWRKTIKPYYRKQFEMVKAAGKHIILHSDGYLLDIIPDLIELGVDGLNIQHEIMEEDKLLPLVRGKVCILTDLDRQHVLPQGTPQEVVEHVRRVKQKFWTPQGGIMFHGELNVDVPHENIERMYKAFVELGKNENQ